MKIFSVLAILTTSISFSANADMLSIITNNVDLSVRSSGVVQNDTDGHIGAGASVRKELDILGRLELSASGDLLIDPTDRGWNKYTKTHFEVEAISGLGKEGLMNEDSVRIMKGLVARGRYDRNLSANLEESTLVGLGYALDTEVVRTLGWKLRFLLESGNTKNLNRTKYWVAQARVESDAYVCKGFDDDGKHAVCLNLGIALNAGYYQYGAEGKIGVDYRYGRSENYRLFLNEVRVGVHTGGIVTSDRDEKQLGGQALVGLEIR